LDHLFVRSLVSLYWDEAREEFIMESLAYIHAASSYENPDPDPELTGVENISLSPSALMGLAGVAMAASVLGGVSDRAVAATPALNVGSSGQSVESVQKALGVKVDGHYGAKTQAAVMDFQIRSGLKEIDGVVGQETAKALGLDEQYHPMGYVVTNTGIGLNIRRGPSTYTSIIGGAPDGAYLYQDYETVIYNEGYAWTPLYTGGWVASDYTRRRGGYRDVAYEPDYPHYGGGGYEPDYPHYRESGYERDYPHYRGGCDEGYRRPVSYCGGGDYERPVSGWGGGYRPVAGYGGVVSTPSRIGLNVRSNPSVYSYVIDGADEGSFVGTRGGVIYNDGYAWQRARGGGWVATDYLYPF
jgi:hypothetical protein